MKKTVHRIVNPRSKIRTSRPYDQFEIFRRNMYEKNLHFQIIYWWPKVTLLFYCLCCLCAYVVSVAGQNVMYI